VEVLGFGVRLVTVGGAAAFVGDRAEGFVLGLPSECAAVVRRGNDVAPAVVMLDRGHSTSERVKNATDAAAIVGTSDELDFGCGRGCGVFLGGGAARETEVCSAGAAGFVELDSSGAVVVFPSVVAGVGSVELVEA